MQDSDSYMIDAEERSDELRALLAAIVESSDDAIVGKTLDGIITSWNRGAEKLFGYTAAEAVGQHIFLIIPEERRAEAERVLAALRRGERIDHLETMRRAKDGRLVPVSLTVSPIRNAKGEIIGVSSIARDITEAVRAQAALERHATVLREQAQMLDLANVLARDLDDRNVAPAIGVPGFVGLHFGKRCQLADELLALVGRDDVIPGDERCRADAWNG